jgi:hypothetical protein
MWPKGKYFSGFTLQIKDENTNVAVNLVLLTTHTMCSMVKRGNFKNNLNLKRMKVEEDSGCSLN